MTEDDSIIDQLTGESSRRTFMKSSALASGGLALGASGAGTVAAQQDGGQGGEQMRGLMFQTNYYPRAQFTVRSKPLPWAPVYNNNEDDFLNEENQNLLFSNPAVFQNMNAHVIEWQFAGQNWGFLFVPNAVNVEQGQTYRTSPVFGTFGTEDFEEYGIDPGVTDDRFVGADEGAGLDAGTNELGLITVQFQPVSGGGGGGGGGGGTQTTGGGGDGNQTGDGNQSGGNQSA
ncbi:MULTISPECIES: twin-arginine translocation signal domain-containing protein [Halorussus]|uniref:twin-arginine translocation signal domain-containing protein n=1 Tax=Halorussus TaxID=1070314 RepID=UPI00209CE3E0|nr:twin-arginine translocation signal domain-containing protein [Halorussus vallis]USZ78067.1 twin-arginine translocation signal domain-containing protein [Halorussus vallis]